VTKPVVVHDGARADFEEAFARYEARRAGTGVRFTEAIDEAMGRITPIEQHAVLFRRPGLVVVRVHVRRRFPFRLIVADLPQVLLVLAVANTKQRQGYWKDRLRE
jgi:hypothetical protein